MRKSPMNPAANLVGNVGDMSPICHRQPTISAKFCRQGDVATSTYFFVIPAQKNVGKEMTTFHKYTQ
jgi:hypothetical protein